MAQQIFDELEKRIKADPSLAGKVNGSYLFDIEGNQWTVDLKSSPGSITKGKEGKIDCTITVKEKDFINLMTGKANGQQLFMGGKLKMKGNMGLAMKLSQLSAPKAKL